MPLDLSDTLVIGISSTALFDLSEADAFFRAQLEENRDTAIKKYREFMLERENQPLKDGTGMPLVKALLELNEYKGGDKSSPLVEVVVMSRNSPETGIQVLNNIRSRELPITRHAFTGGESVTQYLEAFDVDLFLTTSESDAQKVIDSKVCAAALVKEPPKEIEKIPEGQVRIAFDGDAVVFDDSSEFIYKSEGIDGFYDHEDSQQDVPMPEGPYATLLRKLARLQERLPFSIEYSPVRIAIVTARNAPAEMRVIKTLREWGVYVDEVFFLGGLEKSKILRAFKAHIFFDDQDTHLETTSKHIASAKVPYASNSKLRSLPPKSTEVKFVEKNAEKEG
ncbi:5'-nucleotidase [Galenea microaerophila]